MRRISSYLDILVDESIWPDLVHSVTFDAMKGSAMQRAPGADKGIWKDATNFFHKGTNRRWEGVLTDDQVRRRGAHRRCAGAEPRELARACRWVRRSQGAVNDVRRKAPVGKRAPTWIVEA